MPDVGARAEAPQRGLNGKQVQKLRCPRNGRRSSVFDVVSMHFAHVYSHWVHTWEGFMGRTA